MSWSMNIDIINAKVKRLLSRIKQYHGYDLPIIEEKYVRYEKELGRGSEGIVHSCVVNTNGKLVKVAAKRVLHASIDSIQNFLNEVFVLSIGTNTEILTTPKLFGIGITSGPYIIDEDADIPAPQIVIYTELGMMSLMELYRSEKIPTTLTVKLWGDIASMLYTIHRNGIIHRDLKPENILVVKIDRDFTGNITKICTRIMDVGMSYRKYIVEYDDIFGTMGYHAPEMLAEEDYDFSSDIFTLGILFIVTLLPLKDEHYDLPKLLDRIDTLKKKSILGRKLYTILKFSFAIPKTLENMLCTMIEKQSKRSITLKQIEKICGIFSNKTSPTINIKFKSSMDKYSRNRPKRKFIKCNSDSCLSIKVKSPLRLRSRIIKRRFIDVKNIPIHLLK